MKNLLRNFTLVAIAFLAFSCSEDYEVKNLEPTTITKLLRADSTGVATKFSLFVEALESTGMDTMLDEPGEYTVLAPTNDAMNAALGGLSIEDFETANPGLLQNVLKNHIINSVVLTEDFTDGQTLTTSLGQTITVDFQPNTYYPAIDSDLGAYEETSIFVNSARIFARDAKASNGRINVIDSVLLPVTGS